MRGAFALAVVLSAPVFAEPALPDPVAENRVAAAIEASGGDLVYFDGLDLRAGEPVIIGYAEALVRLDTHGLVGTPTVAERGRLRQAAFVVTFARRAVMIEALQSDEVQTSLSHMDGDLSRATSVLYDGPNPNVDEGDVIIVIYIVEDSADPSLGACYARHTLTLVYTGDHAPFDPASCQPHGS